jgi:hypothetical protein
MSIDFVCAKSLAEQHLHDLESQPDGVQYVILDEFIREDEEGWYFPYQSAAYVTTGDFNKSLVGNWPIFIRRSDGCVGSRRPGLAFNPEKKQYLPPVK